MGTIDSWSSIEAIIRQRLELNEIDRRYCAVCGRQGPSLSRCFGCQMVYYCGEEHQAEDWSKEHAQKCTQLDWVALGEFIQALPAQPPLPNVGDKWLLSLNEINNWENWFSIRTNIVNLANNTATIFKNLVHLTDKRQPTYQNAVDGLLAAVTDLLTHVLTIGKAVVYFGLQPSIRPLVIHILNGFYKNDFVSNYQSLSTLPARFHELLNMFPNNKGIELVVMISDDDQDNTDHSSIPHTKLKPDRLIITTTSKGRLLDTSEEKRLQRTTADLVVYFNAAHLFTSSNKELFKSMLIRQCPTLLTFEDSSEFNQAHTYLLTKGVNIQLAGINQFSSLIIRQRSSKPNSMYSTNSYQILLNTPSINSTVERNNQNFSLLSGQHSHQSPVNIQHGHTKLQQQFNPGLKQQVSGETHIESLSSSSSAMSHNTQANNRSKQRDTDIHIVSSANTTTTVQPSVRSNNNMREPSALERQHQSPTTITSTFPTTATTTSNPIKHPTTIEMTTAVELTRNYCKPLPKPRLSLVKTMNEDAESTVKQTNGIFVQRIKPVFEQPSIMSPKESQVIGQQRQYISTPCTYQKESITKATCLDDVISSKNSSITSSARISSLSMETYIHGRTAATAAAVPLVSSSSPVDVSHVERIKTVTEHRTDEKTVNMTSNSTSSSLTTPIETYRDQQTLMNATSIASPLLSSSIENYSNGQVVAVAAINSSPTTSPPIEIRSDQLTEMPLTKSNSSSSRILPPLSSSANNEVIYTEVIKNQERPLSSHHTDLIELPISSSRSFILPSKSSSISSKNSSFNIQRPSRSLTMANFSSHTNKSKPIQSIITPDRISLYSQRSNKQSEVGVRIENLSECIDRVGIVFDETNRSNDKSSTGLTTVDLIREQLTISSTSKPTGSLLDKLHESNSNNLLPTSSSSSSLRTSLKNSTTPRSKSQQVTRNHDEQSLTSKITPALSTSTPQLLRRNMGVFLPLTQKNTLKSIQTTSTACDQSSMLVYENLESNKSKINSISKTSNPDYKLKQHSGPVCTGIPKPFRKPTAIIEPSPVMSSPIVNNTEPNYINLIHHDEPHIYTNENGTELTVNSNSNSYTNKTSSIYSSFNKPNLSTRPENFYAVSHVPSSVAQQQELSIEYDSFDDELVMDDLAKIEKPLYSNDNTDNDSFDDDENQLSIRNTTLKNSSTNFLRSTLNRLTRSNKSLEYCHNDISTNDYVQESNPSNVIDTKTKKTLRSIKARREAKKIGNLSSIYAGDDDTTSIDSNCSTQTATSLNKPMKTSHNRFRLFRRKVEKDFVSDTEVEKHQTEQRRKKWNKKMLHHTAYELKAKRLLMMSDDDDDDHVNNSKNRNLNQQLQNNVMNDETHIYDHIVHDETNNNNMNPFRLGKLSNETHLKSPIITLDEIRSEIQAEIAARQDTQINNQSVKSSSLNLKKNRSKSVTFLDELLINDSQQTQQQTNVIINNDLQIKTSTTIKRIEKGDARSICGALTGTGPIRGIIKAANNDITGTTAPVSPSAAAATAIYLSGKSIEARCTSPKANERTHRPFSTYTVGSARFYDGTPLPSYSGISSSSPTNSVNHDNTVQNHRPILNNSHHSTVNSGHAKRPTAKVSPFQTNSPNDSSLSTPMSNSKQTSLSSTSKKPIRPTTQRNISKSHDLSNVATSSVSDSVGGVSKRLQSNF